MAKTRVFSKKKKKSTKADRKATCERVDKHHRICGSVAINAKQHIFNFFSSCQRWIVRLWELAWSGTNR